MSDLNQFGKEGGASAVADDWETIIPVRDQILVMPDKPKEKTKGGIYLPESARAFPFRGRVLAISWFVRNQYDAGGVPEQTRVKVMDRIAFTLNNTFVESEEKLLEGRILISIANVIAILKSE